MRALDYLIKRANEFELVGEYLNKDTIKVYSPKYLFDSWLLREVKSEIEIWHESKRYNLKKCSYHLHAVIPKKKKIRALQKIKSHNEYVAFHKRANKLDFVERVLAKEKHFKIS